MRKRHHQEVFRLRSGSPTRGGMPRRQQQGRAHAPCRSTFWACHHCPFQRPKACEKHGGGKGDLRYRYLFDLGPQHQPTHLASTWLRSGLLWHLDILFRRRRGERRWDGSRGRRGERRRRRRRRRTGDKRSKWQEQIVMMLGSANKWLSSHLNIGMQLPRKSDLLGGGHTDTCVLQFRIRGYWELGARSGKSAIDDTGWIDLANPCSGRRKCGNQQLRTGLGRSRPVGSAEAQRCSGECL